MGYSPWGHKRVGYDLTTKRQQQMLSQIKQSFKGYSAGPLRGELSGGEEAGSAVRLGPTSSPHSRLAAVKL